MMFSLLLVLQTYATVVESFSRIQGSASWIPFSTDKYTGHQTLNSGNVSVELFWVANKDQDTIEFGVASQNGNTWVAIGTSDAGGMVGATIWLGYSNQGTFVLEDRYATTYGKPALSATQSSKLLSSYQTSTLTAFTFQRSISSCNNQSISLALDQPMWFIYAVGTDNTFQKHQPGHNGQGLVDLSQSYFQNYVEPTLDANTTVVPVVAPSINLPGETTAYCYHYVDMKQLIPEKRHIIKEGTAINHPFVHHIVGYFCEAPPPEFTTPDKYFCNIYRPNGNDTITYNNTCTLLKLAWAKGGVDRLFPANVGKPIGSDSDYTRHLMIEIHYNNPDQVSGQTDPGSGFNLTVTKNLRPQEVGMITSGVSQDFILLPPNSTSSVVGECGTKCTNTFPSSGLTVLSSLNHMHKHGKSLTVQHIRGGQELQRLPSITNFDFNFQSYTFVSTNQTQILPGDRIRVNCTYNTAGETGPVVGGFSSSNEMCYSFIEYYPAMDYFTFCVQVPDISYLPKYANLSYSMFCPANANLSSSMIPNTLADMPPFNALDLPTCSIKSDAIGMRFNLVGFIMVLFFSI
ncbi:DBH-like monooxygenase protein 1 [Boothiomyces macroporosus]|uniref:DBH-like monooxygenase protein 1 n=1 Tax=Boothiomyces macroporosus TaxID=261099 RepID=A0AAD5UHN4_9FUNG|nr:DBH-like monooxygenase protein 1 [Boothiomyces macroporosus]